jgi:hypothetical protein
MVFFQAPLENGEGGSGGLHLRVGDGLGSKWMERK